MLELKGVGVDVAAFIPPNNDDDEDDVALLAVLNGVDNAVALLDPPPKRVDD